MRKKSVEFFMMLTNRSVLMAKYTIGSYKSVYNLLNDKYDLKLTCYLNAVNKQKWGRQLIDIQKDMSQCPGFLWFVDGKYSSEEFVWEGSYYQVEGSSKHYKLPMVTPAEGQDEYFQKCTADYFVTVDDDFEILDPQFVRVLLEYMDDNDSPCISTDKTIVVRRSFDPYSNAYTEGQPRNCTWFCVYRVAERIPISMCVVDSFTSTKGDVITWKGSDSEITWDEYERVFRNEDGVRKTWDNGGWLQEKMRKGKPLVSLGDLGDYSKQYIHYAAFASNSFINTAFKTAVYRFLRQRVLLADSRIVKKVYNKARKMLFPDRERRVSNQKSSMD